MSDKPEQKKHPEPRFAGYVEDIVRDTSPVPSAHKSLDDYQKQLEAKKKRKKRR